MLLSRGGSTRPRDVGQAASGVSPQGRGSSSSPEGKHRPVASREFSADETAAVLHGRLNRRSSIQGFATTLGINEGSQPEGAQSRGSPSRERGISVSNSNQNKNIDRLRTGMQFSKIHAVSGGGKGVGRGQVTAGARGRAVSRAQTSHIPPPATPQGRPLSDAPPAIPPRRSLNVPGKSTKPAPTMPSHSASRSSRSASLSSPPVPAHPGHRSRTSQIPTAAVNAGSAVALSQAASADVPRQGSAKEETTAPPPKPAPRRRQSSVGGTEPLAVVTARHAFVGAADTELSFQKDARIVVMKKTAEKGWWFGIVEGSGGGKGGWFPSTYVTS